MAIVRTGGAILTVTENGYGKRTKVDEYRVQSRGGVGIINIQTSARNGRVAGVSYVEDEDELMLITQEAKVLRMETRNIRPIKRVTQGVRLIEIDDQDLVVSLARLPEVGEGETGEGSGAGPAGSVSVDEETAG